MIQSKNKWTSIYLDQRIKVTLGICLTDKKLVDEGLQLLELTDEQTLLEACQSDVNRFFKK